MTFRRILAAVALAGVALTACTPPGGTTPGGNDPSPVAGPPVLTEEEVAPLVQAVPEKAGKDLDAQRLGEGLLPPTNRWFSGLVFGPEALPVFPLPLSFGLEDNGFAFGLPPVSSTGKTIIGGYTPTVQVTVPGVDRWEVTDYDELTVTMTAHGDSGPLGEVVIAQGSPFVTFTAAADVELSTNVVFTPSGELHTMKAGENEFALVGEQAEVDGQTVRLPEAGHVTMFPVPTGGDVTAMAELAKDPVVGGHSAYAVGDEASTTLTWQTVGGGQTAFAAMPHQKKGAEFCDLGTYTSAYGTMQVCAGNDLTWSTEVQQARTGLDLSGLDDAERTELADAVKADIAASPAYPADTYFGGKALYRDAQLVGIAEQVGATAEAAELRTKVTTQLRQWMEPDGCRERAAFCFNYDPVNKGLIGQTPSFGSDEYNDHHFHYGYFLYAAGVLAANDPQLAEDIAPVMNLLAADIASGQNTKFFPQRRTFDVYASHSWASGTSPFADGNNQESSSEAVLAWAGLRLWAQASENEELATQGAWMQALEAQAAQAYWTDFDTSDPVYRDYDHSIVPLNFGGKRDYATWFSAEPAAALAILIIPASPSSDHLMGEPDRIRANVAEGTANGGFQQQYGDYMMMYSALAGEEERQQALVEARTMGPQGVDDGNTYSYLLAWLLSLES